MAQLVFYRRVSTEEQGQTGNGLEAQLAALQRFAEYGQHTVAADFAEVASGAVGLSERLQLRLALARARQVKGVLIVSRLDRLSRSVAFIATMMQEQVAFATAEDGLDCAPLMLHIKASFAEQERLLISQRTKAALAAKKARGEPLGSHTHKVPLVTRAKATAASKAVQQAKADAWCRQVAPMLWQLRQSGQTMAQVAETMNSQGIATARGGKWQASTVCNALARAGK